MPPVRFIPTGVGNTKGDMRKCRISPVHPHGCGEHLWFDPDHCRESGSSPRVWGTLLPRPWPHAAPRFIPTGVGNTSPGRNWKARPPVHPHGCGEHKMPLGSCCSYCGSSPRVWGTRLHQEAAGYNSRFIPTGVGNTWEWRASRRWNAVHPHGCGDHQLEMMSETLSGGSSPRVWGTPVPRSKKRDHCRFIPTGVGNTRAICVRVRVKPVHPHGCGEHSGGGIQFSRGHGSSPRVWGTRR